LRASEERIGLDEWRQQCLDGTITEAFACGTAAVVTPVGRVRSQDGDCTISDGEPGPIARQLRSALIESSNPSEAFARICIVRGRHREYPPCYSTEEGPCEQ